MSPLVTLVQTVLQETGLRTITLFVLVLLVIPTKRACSGRMLHLRCCKNCQNWQARRSAFVCALPEWQSATVC